MVYNILITDDSIIMRQMLNMTLTDAEYSVIEAGDGLEALELAKVHLFDLVITDINMPIVDGFELVNKVCKKPNSFPVIALSGAMDGDRRAKLLDAGVAFALSKPFELNTLAACIEATL